MTALTEGSNDRERQLQKVVLNGAVSNQCKAHQASLDGGVSLLWV
jgi:hypothetical protein